MPAAIVNQTDMGHTATPGVVVTRIGFAQFRHLLNLELRHAHALHAYAHVYAPGPLLRVLYLPPKLRGMPLTVMYTATHVHFFKKS